MKIEYRIIKLNNKELHTMGFDRWIMCGVTSEYMYFYRPIIATGTNSYTPIDTPPDDNKKVVNDWIRDHTEEWNSIKYDCSLSMKQEEIESMAYPAKLDSLAKKEVYKILGIALLQ